MEEVKNSLEVSASGFEEKYLGLPTPDGRMSKGKFQNLQVRLTKHLFSLMVTLLKQEKKLVSSNYIRKCATT